MYTTIATEEQVVTFFKSKLTTFQAKLPGYATLKFEFTIHSSGSEVGEWVAYHESNGHSPMEAGSSCDHAILWHFSSGAVERKIKSLREEAAEKIKLADQLANDAVILATK